MQIAEKYLRMERIPHIWCPGCGNGIALGAALRALDRMNWDMNQVVMVSGIGCSSRATGYVDACTLHTTHGRALAFATGIKLARPELKVIVMTGDGDASAIGGNHLIHAARRNIDLTVILYNNFIYGMTGGQCSPTTPCGSWSSTTPDGNPDPAFDISALVAAAGASFVARTTVYHVVQLENYIHRALSTKGFSMVEAMTPCPTAFGRKNKQKTPAAMMEFLKTAAKPLDKAPAEGYDAGIIPVGVVVDRQKPEFIEQYEAMAKRIMEAGK
jgi:2-oxoglutarate ferredoxin oxidoreductase subunit beta